MKKKHRIYFLIAILTAAVLLAGLYLFQNKTEPMTYNALIEKLDKGSVEKVMFGANPEYFTVVSENHTYKVPNPKSDELFHLFLKNEIPIEYADETAESSYMQLLIIPLLGIVFLIFRFSRKGTGLIKNAGAGGSNASALRLDDVAGNMEAKAMVDDIIQFIKNPDKYLDLGAKMPRGLLFYGPPGTGKTLMAKAIAGEASVPFYPMSGSDFVQMYVGVGASRVRDLFKKAKKAEKAVIFIDEIDAIGKRRGKQSNGSNDERDQTLNALLTEMSGFNEHDGIIVIAATNRPDTLDEALTRPGRFDRMIEIGLPDVNARRKILELHAKEKPLSDKVNMEELSKSTVSFSGAMLENLLNEAAIFAANEENTYIEPEHIDKAFYTVIAGAEKVDTSYITPQDRKVTAYHEAGHALITKLRLPDSFISKVTIIPSVQGAGGFSLSIPKDTLYLTKQKMIGNIMVLLAGRAAEEIIFGGNEITTGAGNDIEKASKQMTDFINKYGMDETFGIFNMNVLENPPNDSLLDLCRERMQVYYADTKKELLEHGKELKEIANELLEKETLNAEDIDRLCA